MPGVQPDLRPFCARIRPLSAVDLAERRLRRADQRLRRALPPGPRALERAETKPLQLTTPHAARPLLWLERTNSSSPLVFSRARNILCLKVICEKQTARGHVLTPNQHDDYEDLRNSVREPNCWGARGRGRGARLVIFSSSPRPVFPAEVQMPGNGGAGLEKVLSATLRPDFLAAKSRSSSRATRKTPSQSRRARSKDHCRDFSSSEPPIPSASGTKSRRRRPRYERQSAASAATSKQGAIGSAAARSSRPFADTSFERKDRRLRCSERERGSAAKREIDMGDWASKGTTKSMGGGLGCLEAAYLINISIFRACCSDLNATDRA